MRRSRPFHTLLVCTIVLSVVCAALPASAGQFTNLVVFGDSLSDTGNMLAATGGGVPPSPAYFEGRFSNGPVWPEYLASALDLPLQNLAYGGAQTGQGNLFGPAFPGLSTQIALWKEAAGPADPDAIYIVWAGANDVRAALAAGATPNIPAMIENILNAVAALYAAGARHVVVPNLPDLGLTPEGLGSGFGTEITYLSAAFNWHLDAALSEDAPAVVRLDVFTVMNQAVTDPLEYGFTNATTPCLTAAGVCPTPDSYLFWDHVHPTTYGHAVLAEKYAKAINQALVKRQKETRR